MNDFVKTKNKFKNQLYNTYIKNGYKDNDYDMLQEVTNEVSKIISKRKEEYHYHLASKLNNPSTSAKRYWSILKTFYNGKKVPLIPPLQIGNTLVSDFKKTSNIFNKFFASQCVPLNSDSNIPYCQRHMANAKISSIKFENKDIINVIKALDPCKAHGYDYISIRMLKICGSTIVKPLTILFKNYISQGIFPDNWEKSNICPIHKKGDKQIVNNYRPVSLLPICGKIFERLIFNSLYQFLEEHNLLSIHQSGFGCNDSCINQLLFIVHTLYKAFHAYPTLYAKGVFFGYFQGF